MSKTLYLCSHCRAKIIGAQKALFVDQSTNRPFCSESCIIEFHTPYMESFEQEELSRKERAGVDLDEGLAQYYQHHDLFQNVLYSPDEVWFEKNPIGEEYYTHIKKVKRDDEVFFYIVICSYFDNEPSFVFFKSITKSPKLADFYRTKVQKGLDEPMGKGPDAGLELDEAPKPKEEVQNEVEIPQEALEDLELKKSEYLASLLENRKDEDIAFEEFTKYDEFLPLTLEDPDEVYFREDEAGDETRTYIKSFQAFGQAFFYVVVCLKIELKQIEDQEALLPVIGFPSVDQSLYGDYAIGERISSMVKN